MTRDFGFIFVTWQILRQYVVLMTNWARTPDLHSKLDNVQVAVEIFPEPVHGAWHWHGHAGWKQNNGNQKIENTSFFLIVTFFRTWITIQSMASLTGRSLLPWFAPMDPSSLETGHQPSETTKNMSCKKDIHHHHLLVGRALMFPVNPLQWLQQPNAQKILHMRNSLIHIFVRVNVELG